MVTGQIDWAVLDQLTTVWLTTHGHGHTGSPPDGHPARPPEDHADGRRTTTPTAACRRPPHGPQEDPADGRPDDHADGRLPEDHADGPREDHAEGPPDDHPDGPRDDHPDGPRDDHPDGPREASRTDRGKARRTAGRTAATRTSQPPAPATPRAPGSGPYHGYVPFPGTGPGPGQVPAAADDHDCGIAGCLEATRRRLQATILRWSLDLLSGPGGLASHLRGTVLGAPFNTLSQPLDIGRTTRTIPPHLRTAVIQRDQHCQFPRLHPATLGLRRAPPDPLGQTAAPPAWATSACSAASTTSS